ncbi:aldo/keto reductase [Romeria aff. gracilis LEGE 07310]|uniref:Aldo/keto reductase n=1 Tax=Vasconcelosia minhoensis LEGE 07310 TaxID=915328 RepID=A0A8J7DMN4_9CYAN|nr:aldo/keto reductase [Romeria gracilis]MBE9077015.1 aldo/keto reductase [Romeria aff. gracilis LEGE 07310]
MKTLLLPSGNAIPVLGQGTWKMGERPSERAAEVEALQLGIELGMTLIDTAEMYGEGGAEEVIADAIAGQRSEVFLVSKVYPYNASRQGAVAACDRSLRRLQTDYLDLYLLHWPGSVPLAETLEAFQSLQAAGKIRDYGVSNFDQDGMAKAIRRPGGENIATNQVMYNLMHRGIEWDLLPWCRQQQMPVMAYSPIGQSASEQQRLFGQPQLQAVATRHEVTPAQVALAWLLQQGIVVIPKATQPEHVRENRAALDLTLTAQDLAELERAFPPPRRKTALEIR